MRRPAPIRRAVNSMLLLAILLAVAASFRFLQLDVGGIFSREAAGAMGTYVGGFLRPDFSDAHLQAIGQATLETLAMSAIGTLLAAILGLVLALPAARRLAARRPAAGLLASISFATSRLLLNALRAVPELVWAALMVLAAGLGPNAGTLALALHTAGVLGRLFAETLENTPGAPAHAVRLAGGGALTAFAYGTLPGAWPQLLAYTLYRWENNIRMAAILGFVGAGGLGQLLYISLSLFQEARAATVILAMLLLVLAVDALSGWARQRWANRQAP